MSVRGLTRAALLAAAALIMFVIEAQFPHPIPIPGLKLGLANIIIVYAVYAVGHKQAFAVLCSKIVLGSILAGGGIGFWYSAAGGLLCFCVMLLMRHVLSHGQIWVCSVLGAVAHNTGQILMAVFLMRTAYVLAYLPFLLASGLVSGLVTGLAAQAVHKRLVRHLRTSAILIASEKSQTTDFSLRSK